MLVFEFGSKFGAVADPGVASEFTAYLGRAPELDRPSVDFELHTASGRCPYGFAVRPRDRVVLLMDRSQFIDHVVAARIATSMWGSDAIEHYHCAVLAILTSDGPRHLAVFGASGSGKSTLVGAFAQEIRLSIVCEDWTGIDHETMTVRPPWKEDLLHLKKPTAAVYESLIGARAGVDRTDSTRAFYSWSGRLRLPEVRVDAAVVLAPGSWASGLREFRSSDVERIREGAHSPYYGAEERWLDGSTSCFGPAEDERRSVRLTELTQSIPVAVVESHYRVREQMTDVLDWLRSLPWEVLPK